MQRIHFNEVVTRDGFQNEPAFVRDVAQFIADLRQIPLAELAEATSHNFFELFKLAKK